jgi:hypothetical protein
MWFSLKRYDFGGWLFNLRRKRGLGAEFCWPLFLLWFFFPNK